MKKIKTKIVITIIAILLAMLFISNPVKALTKTEEENILAQSGINTNNIDKDQFIALYDEYSAEYSNEELAKMIEENKEAIKKQTGASEETIKAGITILETTDPETLKEIMTKDINVEEVKKQLDEGKTLEEAISNNISNEDAAQITFKLLFANTVFTTYFTVVVMLTFLGIIIKWIIYNKAGEHGWAAIIPIYRDVVYYKVCGISPWVLLWWLLPIIGWLILLIITVISRFKLAKGFGRGAIFGIGLWFFPTIFEIILACSKKKYIGFEE